jgi:hypothetical protein
MAYSTQMTNFTKYTNEPQAQVSRPYYHGQINPFNAYINSHLEQKSPIVKRKVNKSVAKNYKKPENGHKSKILRNTSKSFGLNIQSSNGIFGFSPSLTMLHDVSKNLENNFNGQIMGSKVVVGAAPPEKLKSKRHRKQEYFEKQRQVISVSSDLTVN